MDYSPQQKQIINTNEPRVVVCSSAASGKTAVLVGRLQKLVKDGVEPNKIVAITFTNNAAAEISDRLNRPNGLFVGTIHSYANYLLLSAGLPTSDIIEQELFDRLFKRIKEHPHCIKPVEYLLLDEAQDSTPAQFEFLLDMINPKNWFLVGDWRQSLYQWNGADPNYLIELSEKDGVVTYNLDENYRNGKKILTYAKAIIRLAGADYIDMSTPMSEIEGKVLEGEYEPVTLARYIKREGNYGKWFVLARTNEQIDTFARFLKNEKVPYDTFKRAQLDNAQLNTKLKENTVKVLTIHAAKGLEVENVAVIGARFYNTEERCASYVAATRAKELLIWLRMPNRIRQEKMVSNWES